MYVVREVLRCKPGRAKDLVAIFKNTFPHMEGLGLQNRRVMTDTVSTYWTVVVEMEVEHPRDYWAGMEKMQEREEIGAAMKDYMDCLQGGHREIFKIEYAG